MRRYFLHIHGTTELIPDPDGSLLIDDEAAQTEAVLSARDLVAARIIEGRSIGDTAIEVVDQEGLRIAYITLRSVVLL